VLGEIELDGKMGDEGGDAMQRRQPMVVDAGECNAMALGRAVVRDITGSAWI
jgi:hypothetical protein